MKTDTEVFSDGAVVEAFVEEGLASAAGSLNEELTISAASVADRLHERVMHLKSL